VFDRDPQPIFDTILDAHADEFVRSRMCETLSYLGFPARSTVERYATSFTMASPM
jgi:hypothetical protein